MFVCFMNTDRTDTSDFSVSKAKQFVLFVKFVVKPRYPQSASSVFVCFMNTDSTDSDFSVSKEK